jgi:hypothetical protein
MLVFIIFILSLVHYYTIEGEGSKAVINFMDNPKAYAGQTREIMGPYLEQTEDGFIMQYNQRPLRIHYTQPFTPPTYGQVLVYGTLQEDGSIRAIGVHNYNYNYLIYILSLIAGLYVLKVFFTEWKITKHGIEAREHA